MSERPLGGANECYNDLVLNFDRSLGRANDCDKNFGVTKFDRSWGGVGDGGEEGSCKGEDLHIWRWRNGFLVKDLMRRLEWYVGVFKYWGLDTANEMGFIEDNRESL